MASKTIKQVVRELHVSRNMVRKLVRILTAMTALKLYGMKSAYDEIIATGIERQNDPQRVVAALLTSEIGEGQARSIKYQITIAKLSLARHFDDFNFAKTGIDETMVNEQPTPSLWECCQN